MKFSRHLLSTTVLCSFLSVAHGQVTLNPSATRALGAARLEQVNTLTNIEPDLVEGRELNQPLGIALDLASTPAHLYVADSGNNRVLAWKDSTKFANGQPADLVIGQNDLLTTLPQGPGRAGSTRQSSGFTFPIGLAVDPTGNLYVLDAGNNRILRFPHPFAGQANQFPDLVLGQANFTTGTANAGGISASTLAFASTTGVSQAYMKFDLTGNLWVADVLNQRVLRYPGGSLTAGNNGAAADLVLGQTDFSSNTVSSSNDPTSLSVLHSPTGIAFDQGGRLFVSESQSSVRSRILIFYPPFATNKPAGRIIGVVSSTNPVQPPTISSSQLSAAASDVFNINSNISVADTLNSRILIYNPFEQYTSDTLTQNAILVLGQADFNSGKANRANADASNSTLASPTDAAYSGTELFVTDTGNNRVVVLPSVPNSSTLQFNGATRVLGQDSFAAQAPNLLEGREFRFADVNPSNSADAGIAVDLKANPPHLYVADPYNNRILCFVDLRRVTTGSKADLVIGQSDFTRAVINYPSGSANTPSAQGLFHPTGVTVDASGNLWVADTGNGRVLRFPSPFTQPSTLLQSADLVLGQSTFTSKITDPTQNTLGQPYGLTFAPNNAGLLVSDILHNRVVMYPGPGYTSGMAATKLWGQATFFTTGSGNLDNRFNAPHHIAVDSTGRLYVVDSGNGRVLIFGNVQTAGSDPHSVLSIGSLSSPRSVFLDPTDGIWIGDNTRAVRFSGGFNSLVSTNFTPDLVLSEAGALALAVDSANALYVADVANRVVVHYVGLSALNSANYLTSRTFLAPNTITALYSLGGQFGAGMQSASSLPLPTTMVAIQVQLNGTPLPLYYVSPSQINFLLPNNVPTSGTADLQVIRTDNGQVLGDTTINLNTEAPGLYTLNGAGTGQAAAINDDGTVNGPTNPIARTHVLQVFGTGIGFIQGAPSDGSATTGPMQTSSSTVATINGIPCAVQYSGLAPGQVGVWQVNVYIDPLVVPTSSAPNKTSQLLIQLNGTPSGGAGLGREVDVWVKQ
jgi:uncharacterized protein (TIGR03437 family)